MTSKQFTTFLTALEKLEARPLPLAPKAARGREAPLFKALGSLSSADFASEEGKASQARLAAALAERLGDSQLSPAILTAADEFPWLAKTINECLETRVKSSQSASIWGIEALLEVSEDHDDPLARYSSLIQTEPEEFEFEKVKQILAIRSRTPSERRDPVSTQVCVNAVKALARFASNPDARDRLAKIIVWETARTGKEEPTVALAGIEELRNLDAIDRLRAASQASKTVKRRVVLQRLEAICKEVQQELGLPKHLLSDLLALPLDVPEWVALDKKGEVQILCDENEPAYTEGYERQIRREVERVHEQWTTRLENAMVRQERWPVPVWHACFVSSNCPMRTNLAQRMIWMADNGTDDDTLAVRWDGEQFIDVFGEPCKVDSIFLRLAHPIHMDKEELKLWREAILELGIVQPLPQAFRLFFPKPLTDKFEGCFFPSDPPRLGRARNYVGVPLRGRSPWELTRKIGSCEVTVFVGGAEQKIEAIEWDHEPDKVEQSEFSRDMFDMLGSSFFGDHAFWKSWNSDMKYAPKDTWKKALGIYKRAPKRLPALRLQILEAIRDKIDGAESIRNEGRFVVIDGDDGGIVELGSGHQHLSPHRGFVPQRDHSYVEVPLPHDRQFDPQLDRVIGLIAFLAARAAKNKE